MRRLAFILPFLATAQAIPAAPAGQYGVYELAEFAGRTFGIPPKLMTALVYQESRGKVYARSSVGAMGLAQLMPATAAELGVSNPWDAWQNVWGGAKYLRQQLNYYGGRIDLALAAYNAGAGNVNRYGGVPPFKQTRDYVRNITAHYATLTGAGNTLYTPAPRLAAIPAQQSSPARRTYQPPQQQAVILPTAYRAGASTLAPAPIPVSSPRTQEAVVWTGQQPLKPVASAAAQPQSAAPQSRSAFQWSTNTLSTQAPAPKTLLLTTPMQISSGQP